MYLSNARRMTSDAVSPFDSALSLTFAQSSSATRMLREGVLGWLGNAVHQRSQPTPNCQRKILIKPVKKTVYLASIDDFFDCRQMIVFIEQCFSATFCRLRNSKVVHVLLGLDLWMICKKLRVICNHFFDCLGHFIPLPIEGFSFNRARIIGVPTPCQAPLGVK